MKKLLYTILPFLLSFSIMAQPKIKAVYFAQTHVVKFGYLIPNANEKLKLIMDRDALIKVNITSPTAQASPVVKVRLILFKDSTDIILTGPANLPTSFDDTFGKVIHKFDDSFTATMPKKYIRAGLRIKIITPNETWNFTNLSISAPNRIFMTNLEINAFSLQNSPFTTGWETEFGSKLPTAEFKVQNVPNILFPTIVVPPTGTAGNTIATKCSSLAEFLKFGTHNVTSKQWKSALSDAAGRNYGNMNYVSVSATFTDRYTKGEGGGYSSVQRRGGAGGVGTFFHELGHALSLPHWEETNFYPYKGEMHGIKTLLKKDGSPFAGGNHAGPIWAYDYVKKTFIKPTTTLTAPLLYKTDPMAGGGQSNPEPGYLINHFSDYSVNQMRNMLENHLVIYNTFLQKYCKWSKNNKFLFSCSNK